MMKLLIVDESGAIAQEYRQIFAQVDGINIDGETLKVIIPGETDAEFTEGDLFTKGGERWHDTTAG